MKHLIAVLLLTLSSISLNSTAANDVVIDDTETIDWCSEPEENLPDNFDSSICDTSTEVTTEEYTRKEKVDGIWYGIIEVTEVESSLSGMSSYGGSANTTELYIAFNRDLESLDSITFDGTPIDTCAGHINVYGWCVFGYNSVPTEYDITIYNKTTDGTFADWLLNDGISTTNYENYDYHVHLRKAYKSIDIVSFIYVLTNEEIDNVTVDIQQQYDDEVTQIMLDESMTLAEKESALTNLKLEYAEYTIEYGESIESRCLTEICKNIVPVNYDPKDPLFEGFDNLLADIARIVAIVVSSGIALTIASMIIYRVIVNVIMKGSTNFVKGTLNVGYKSGTFWGNKIVNGITKAANGVHNALSNVFGNYTPLIYLSTIAAFVLLFIL